MRRIIRVNRPTRTSAATWLLIPISPPPAEQFRYFNFLTSTDAAVPQTDPAGVLVGLDTQSSIDGTRIAFTRLEVDRTAIFLYDTATSSLTEIDPHPGSFPHWRGNRRLARGVRVEDFTSKLLNMLSTQLNPLRG